MHSLREIQGWMYQSWSKPLFAINTGRQFEHIWSVHITHSFSYLNACKCRVFRIASKPCKTIIWTVDCSQCDGSRLKMYNRCHNMREWADNLQSLKLYLWVLSSIKRCRHYHVIYFTNERYHVQAFLLTSFVLRGISWSTSRIRNVLHELKVLHEIAQSNTTIIGYISGTVFVYFDSHANPLSLTTAQEISSFPKAEGNHLYTKYDVYASHI